MQTCCSEERQVTKKEARIHKATNGEMKRVAELRTVCENIRADDDGLRTEKRPPKDLQMMRLQAASNKCNQI